MELRTRSYLTFGRLPVPAMAILAVLAYGRPAHAVSCSGLPAFASCTAYASGAAVTFGGNKYTAAAAIPNTRDCPPNSPYDPGSDNWWTNNGACDAATATARATNTSTATATRTPTATARVVATATFTNTATATARATATATTGSTATFTATRTNTATATATTSGTCTDPAWVSTTQYCAGAKVSRNGSSYTANYCSTGSDPATNNGPLGSGQPWFPPAACGGATATSTSTSTSTATATRTPTATGRATATFTATARVTATATTATATPSGGRRIVGYFAQWGIYSRNFFPAQIEKNGQIGPVGSAPTKLTHINYAFANINLATKKCDAQLAAPNGDPFADYQKSIDAATSVDGVGDLWSDLVRGNWGQMKKLKARHPGLKVMMSIGGWSWSDGFYTAAQPANRAAFVASCIDLYIKGNLPFDSANNTGGPGTVAGIFDGIDLDWEYPGACGNNPSCGASSADTANYTGLLAEFRNQMNALPNGSSYLLTTAVPAGSEKISLVDVPGMAANVSWINLMSYDFFGAWAPLTAHHSALDAWTGMPSTSPQNTYYSSFAVNDWTSNGMPASKINLGIGFYGRGWTGVPNVNSGLNQTATGGAAPCGGFVGCENGISDYKYLVTLGYPNFYGAGTHWAFSGTTFWSYDDPTSITSKMTWAKAQGLGGAIVWSLDGDAGTTLMDAVNTIK